MHYTTFVGLDVHKETIVISSVRAQDEVRDLGSIPNQPDAIAKVMKKLGSSETLLVCYEAGPCGYGIYRQLKSLGIDCLVVAPSLIPKRPGDRIKTDRRDARNLARLLRSGDLEPVWVPDEEHEAFRQLVRAREDAQQDVTRKRHQISKFLLVNGINPPKGINSWTVKHRQWLWSLKLPQGVQNIVLGDYLFALQQAEDRVKRLEAEVEKIGPTIKQAELLQALQALRGVSLITASVIVAETGDLTRFQTAKQAMAYAGLVPSEFSSGNSIRRGSITRSGNSHLRHVLVEAAWHYRRQPAIGIALSKRQQGVSESVKNIAWNAQQRLNRKFSKCLSRNKSAQVSVVAVARELLGFMWAIAKEIQRLSQDPKAA